MIKKPALRSDLLVFAAVIAILALTGVATWERVDATRSARLWTDHTYEVLGAVRDLDVAVRDAETGQRGYLLTGKDSYLEPYQSALDRIGRMQGELKRMTADSRVQQDRLDAVAGPIQRKLEELAQTIQLRRSMGLEAALAVVQTDAGRDLMAEVEKTLAAMRDDERALLRARLSASDARSTTLRWLVSGGTLAAVLALAWAARLLNLALQRSRRAERDQGLIAERLRTALDSLSQGVAVFGSDHALTNSNDCFRALLDLPRAMVRPGTAYSGFVEHLSGGDGDVLESVEQVRHGSSSLDQPVTYERRRPDGHDLEFRRTGTPDGGFVLTVTDMTRRAQAEAVLREAQKMQAIGQLTGGIAHDFNNLLTVILGSLEFIGARFADDTKMKARVERAAWAAQRGATLTSQLLSFARKQPLAPAPVDLAATMPDLVPLLRRTLGEAVDVRYVEAAGLWPAMADPAQLEAAVLNLALNARDAMPGGGRLTIELANKVLDADYARSHAEVTAGDYAMVGVSDTGCGMAPKTVARVFEPFFTTKPDGKGTGLGLAMVFGFVKQSGGHVKIYSEPGQGTTVRLYLPRAIDAPVARTRYVDPIDLPRGSATILVVEDEPSVREIAVEILSELGYAVLQAGDGEEALRVFGANAGAIELLLTDVVLPGELRGRDVAERITAMRPQIKVLFMSGYTENSIVHHGRLDDGVELLGKPFRREQLARRVADVIGRAGMTAGNVVAMKPRREA